MRPLRRLYEWVISMELLKNAFHELETLRISCTSRSNIVKLKKHRGSGLDFFLDEPVQRPKFGNGFLSSSSFITYPVSESRRNEKLLYYVPFAHVDK